MNVFWSFARRSFFLWFGAIWMAAGLIVFFGSMADSPGEIVPLILGGLFGATGTALVTVNLRRIIRQHRLFQNGTPAEALITNIRPSNYKTGGTYLNYIHYRYSAANGSYDGKSPPMHPRETNRWSKGDRVIIRYDPAKPGESIWIEL